MSFYLLKSSVKRQRFGDILVNLDEIVFFGLGELEFEDVKEKCYIVHVYLGKGDRVKACYSTVEQAKAVIREMTGYKVTDAMMDDFLPQVD